MFFIKHTLDSTRTNYTKNAVITYCTKNATIKEIKLIVAINGRKLNSETLQRLKFIHNSF